MQIRVYKDLMGENEKWASRTRELLSRSSLPMVNLIGSPGAGKTALLEATAQCDGAGRFAVLEGDVETTRDAVRLKKAGVEVSQLLSGGACHLEAKLVYHALRDMECEGLSLIVVENVGNLVCPAEFDIGETHKVAVLSVAEGEDKPVKYPLLFRLAGAVILTKIDLVEHLDFDMESCKEFIRAVNPNVPIIQLSARTGEGVDAWIEWLNSLESAQKKPEPTS